MQKTELEALRENFSSVVREKKHYLQLQIDILITYFPIQISEIGWNRGE